MDSLGVMVWGLRGLVFGLLCFSTTVGVHAGEPLLRKLPADAVFAPRKAPDGNALGTFVPLADPSGRALNRFYGALKRTEKGQGKTRIVVYGASHMAGDSFTRRIRHWLQERFGDAGPGFVGGFKPWRNYNHRDVRITYSKRWESFFVSRTRSRSDGLYGLAGASFSSGNPLDFSRVATARRGNFGRSVTDIEVFYWKQRKGGDFTVNIDGNVKRIKTASKSGACGYAKYKVSPGRHTVELKPVGNGKVLLFGMSLERDQAGVVMDSMGINGARASAHLRWNDTVYKEHLRKRNPDLVIMAYGTNATGDKKDPIDKYEARLDRVMRKMRAATPQASCIYIGPSDRPVKVYANQLHPRLVQRLKWKGKWRPIKSKSKKRRLNPVVFFQSRPRQAQVIAVQRRVANRHGCAYWDWNAMMGGSLSMVTWTHAKPRMGSRDYVHHSGAGYGRAAQLFWDALMVGYPTKKAH